MVHLTIKGVGLIFYESHVPYFTIMTPMELSSDRLHFFLLEFFISTEIIVHFSKLKNVLTYS